MRRALTFDCSGATLAGMAHPADGATGVLIVTGGVQTRVGAHRGFVRLADALATAGHPVLRFDRRGVGDSDGADPGFRDSGPDIAAAVAALRAAFPSVRRIVGWGLCDGAAALALHVGHFGLDGLILANPWTRDTVDELPPRAAIATRYRERLTDPREWLRLLRGGVDLRRAVAGLARLSRPEPVASLARSVADGLCSFAGPTLVVLAERDATAQAFAALMRTPLLEPLAARSDVVTVGGAAHTFARDIDAAALEAACIEWLARKFG